MTKIRQSQREGNLVNHIIKWSKKWSPNFPLETVNYYCAGVHVRISFVQGNAEQ